MLNRLETLHKCFQKRAVPWLLSLSCVPRGAAEAHAVIPGWNDPVGGGMLQLYTLGVPEYLRLRGVHGLGGVADVLRGVEHPERQPSQEIPGGEQACNGTQPKPRAA